MTDLQAEKAELEFYLKSSIFEVKQKSAFRGMLLEKKLVALQHVQEEREAQLNEVLSRANLEPTVLGQVKGHVDDILQRKNNEIRRYQAEVVRLTALAGELSEYVDGKLQEYGLTMEELGFVPAYGANSGGKGKKTTPAAAGTASATMQLTNGSMKSTGPAMFSEAY